MFAALSDVCQKCSADPTSAALLTDVLKSEGIEEYTDIGFLAHMPKAKVEAMLTNSVLEMNDGVAALLRFAIKDASSSTTGVIEKAVKEVSACLLMPAAPPRPLSNVGVKRSGDPFPRAAAQLGRSLVACALSSSSNVLQSKQLMAFTKRKYKQAAGINLCLWTKSGIRRGCVVRNL